MKIPFEKFEFFLTFLMNISGLVTKSLFSNLDVRCFISKLTCIWPFHPRFSFNERLSIVKKNRGQRIRQTNYFWWCKDITLFLSFTLLMFATNVLVSDPAHTFFKDYSKVNWLELSQRSSVSMGFVQAQKAYIQNLTKIMDRNNLVLV